MYLQRSRRWLAVLVTLVLVLTPALTDAKKPTTPGDGDSSSPYQFVDLLGVENTSGSVPYYSVASAVSDVNADGNVWIGGFSHLHPQESNHPVRWYADDTGAFQLTDLGLPSGAGDASVADINDLGDVAIRSWNDFDGYETAYLQVRNQSPLLGELVEVTAINNAGEAVGMTSKPTPSGSGPMVGYYWTFDSSGTVTSIQTFADFFPYDISEDGIMVGESRGRAAKAEFDNGGWEVSWLTNDINTTATAISDDGQWIVGQVSWFTGEHWLGEACIWTTTGPLLLGTLQNYGSSSPTAVNNSGQIVGWSDARGKIGQAAFLFDGVQLHDLNQLVSAPSGQSLQYAYDINNSGHIVGVLIKSSKSVEWHGYLLMPIQP